MNAKLKIGKIYRVNNEYCVEGTGFSKSEYYPFKDGEYQGGYRYFSTGTMFLILEEHKGEIRIDHWTPQKQLDAGTRYLILLNEQKAWINFKDEPIERWIEIKDE